MDRKVSEIEQAVEDENPDDDLPAPEGHRNSDHARDLPIHESVREQTKHGRRGLSMPEMLSTPGS